MSCALAIGGLDPGGGAGLAADLRAFAHAGVFGCAAIAVLTIQSTSGLLRATPVAPRDLLAQAREVLRHQRVRAMKVGALGSAANVRAVASLLAANHGVPAVVDTPMLPSRGTGRLLAERAEGALRTALIPRAALVTVNVPEAERLLGARVLGVRDAREAALALCRMGARAALVKGGHLPDEASGLAIDTLAIGRDVIVLRAKRLTLPPTHGTGCTLASLIAGRLAARAAWSLRTGSTELVLAVRWAKRAHHAALSRARDVGGTARVLAFV